VSVIRPVYLRQHTGIDAYLSYKCRLSPSPLFRRARWRSAVWVTLIR